MSRTLRILVPTVCLAALAVPATATAVEQQRTTSSFSDVIGKCGKDDRLVANFTIRETSADYGDRVQLHLHLTGTITRTGTGVTGKYSETQLDKFGADGSERYSGKLSHLVVPGAGSYRAAGHAVFTADGDMKLTPGLAALDEYEDRVCALLS